MRNRYILRSSLAVVLILALGGTAYADALSLRTTLTHPALLAGVKTTTYLKVGVTGALRAKDGPRVPVNVAIVIDKSGSMSGAKIHQARRAAKMAVGRLAATDIVSVVGYDSTVRVLVPATRVSDKATIYAGIDRLQASGNTALFAGVSKGAEEVRKFADSQYLNRIVLISDGLANVGPSTPAELTELGRMLAAEGISVTTLGLGLSYNEDLMAGLARASDGNHAFIEHATSLAHIFDLEFGEVLNAVARDVEVTVHCAPGVRPVRLLGRTGDIIGDRVFVRLNQLFSRREKFLMLEVEISPEAAGVTRALASVSVTYGDLIDQADRTRSAEITARWTASAAEVEASVARDAMVQAIELVASEKSRLAMTLNDQGRQKEAEKVLRSNAAFLDRNFKRYKAPSLRKMKNDNIDDAKNLDPKRYIKARKAMKHRQATVEMQQTL
jgi:Ca-activated chloride channel family protein